MTNLAGSQAQDIMFLAISQAMIQTTLEDQARFLSGDYGPYMEKYEGPPRPDHIAVLLTPDVKMVEQLIPKKFWGDVDAQEYADGIPTHLGINGEDGDPDEWPPKDIKKIAFFTSRPAAHDLCKDDLDAASKVEVIEWASNMVALRVAMEAIAPEVDDLDTVPPATMKKIEREVVKIHPVIYGEIEGKYYDKWWDFYGGKGFVGDQCVAFHFIADVSIWLD